MTRNPLLRPTLLPGVPRLWRDPHTLQLGADPAHAVLLEVADPAITRLLDLLDGSRPRRAVLDQAARLGVPQGQAEQLLDTLQDSGLIVGAHTLLPANLPEPARLRLSTEAAALALRGRETGATPAQILRRRAAARIVLTGRGRLARPLAVTVAEAGVGHVGLAMDDPPVDRAAIAQAVAVAAPGTATGPVRRGQATLVVLLGADRPANLIAASYAQHRQAHIMIDIRGRTPVVGPLVPANGTPCLNCLDLHRRDRDPGWPQLAAQLSTIGPAVTCDAATLLAAASIAAAEILTFVDGGSPETIGSAVEVRAPAQLRRRAWSAHPDCRCRRRRNPQRGMSHPQGGVTVRDRR
ncbi:hypothetical protein O7632_27155 [Solwaraspora sp. WMMD406]|uniref:hypothetical protein n=1 Tax=Solwaraspora sp. WMMD406 TaxID=3016095 RepID=UPI002416C141|nr:hypothetical protein [Solwaraspora sp. WMMD406]MDG4767744.1 hypothetical protein [Solwaraspora sp. WMMD406]